MPHFEITLLKGTTYYHEAKLVIEASDAELARGQALILAGRNSDNLKWQATASKDGSITTEAVVEVE